MSDSHPPPVSSPAVSTHELGEEDRIEVTALVERKTWIQDKIKLLESMPPIDVFQGVEYILPTSSSTEPQRIPGLPTRQEVSAWLSEHQKIEAETEQFDKGDMIRLKNLAKAKSQQNLTPEDTDLIELTLDTLFSLDKLMHLLRSRRGSIEQMGMRIKWEELRIGAWKDRKAILDDVDRFVRIRARWSPEVYDSLGDVNADATGEGSTATQPPLLRSPTTKFLALARSARFKHSETLSREAATYASRVLGFHNTWIKPSGLALDKLIERRTVPDQLLDEQDRLEDQTKELDLVAKFPMTLVMQWKKADELYGELKKDQDSARQLKQELEKALQAHPRPRADEDFISRSSALNTRLTQISDPMTSRSFPRPMNPRYADQRKANDDLASLLSTELRSAIRLARQVSSLAKQYHVAVEAVKRIRKLNGEMAGHAASLHRIADKLVNGTGLDDGLPPSVDSPDSLDPIRHSAFFALLPSILDELETSIRGGDYAVKETRSALAVLASAPLEVEFKGDTQNMIQRVEDGKAAAILARDEVQRRAELLKGARKAMDASQKSAQEVAGMRERVVTLLDRNRWKAERGRDGAPLTPDSPTVGLPSVEPSPADALQRIAGLEETVKVSILDPCSTLVPQLGPALSAHIDSVQKDLKARIAGFRELVAFWQDVRRQTDSMRAIRDDTHQLESEAEIIRSEVQDRRTTILQAALPVPEADADISSLSAKVSDLHQAVSRFNSGLAARVLLVSRGNGANALDHLPFTPASLDHAVKSDANAYSMSLTGQLDSLERNMDQVRLAIKARAIDTELETAAAEIRRVEQSLSSLDIVFKETNSAASRAELEESLSRLREQYDQDVGNLPSTLRRRLSLSTRAVSELEDAPGAHDVGAQESVVLPRKRALSSVVHRSDEVLPRLQALNEHIEHRLEAVFLGGQLDVAKEPIRQALSVVQDALQNELASATDLDLLSPEAASRLKASQSNAELLVNGHLSALNPLIADLTSSKTALLESRGYRHTVVTQVMSASVQEAVQLEQSHTVHAAIVKEIQDLIPKKLQTLDTAETLTAHMDATLEELDGIYQSAHGAISRLDYIPFDAGAVKELRDLAAQEVGMRRIILESVTPTLGSLTAKVSSFGESDAAQLPGATNLRLGVLDSLRNLSNLSTSVDTDLTKLNSRVHSHSTVVENVIAADDALLSIDELLAAAETEMQILSTSSAALATTDLSEDRTVASLSDLREGTNGLERNLSMTISLKVKDAVTRIESLLSVVTDSGLSCQAVAEGRSDRLNAIQRRCAWVTGEVASLKATVGRLEADRLRLLEEKGRERSLEEQKRQQLQEAENERIRAEEAAARQTELESERQRAEEEIRRMAEETSKREEVERQARLAAESETQRITQELDRMRLAERTRIAAEEKAEAERAKAARVRNEELARLQDRVHDVFDLTHATHHRSMSQEESDIKSRIANLRTQLRSLALHTIIRPPSRPGSSKQIVHLALPLEADMQALYKKYDTIVASAAKLPEKLDDAGSHAELASLQYELEASKEMMTRIKLLVQFAGTTSKCDNALSDMLEHLDSYPAPPLETTSGHVTDFNLSAEAQLSSRVGFTSALLDAMKEAATDIMDDDRVVAERERLLQTWSELYEMTMDKLNSTPSRPSSSVRSSSDIGGYRLPDVVPKRASYQNLRRSRASSSLSQAGASGSRPMSVAGDVGRPRNLGLGVPVSRSSSRISNRSVSGPIAGSPKPVTPAPFSPGVYGTTFSSRQRTMSNSSVAAGSVVTPKRAVSRPRAPTDATSPGVASPAVTGTRSAFAAMTRASRPPVAGGNANTPRGNRSSTPSRTPSNIPVPRRRKEYVPNRAHRVDVAVAKVVNELDPEVQVNVEPISWKDQSGKYWIGDKDPKLCFCRILRSQTVMVRVGGGWVELSKFLRGHYDLFRVAPPMIPGSPPREEEEQRWISSATLLAAAQAGESQTDGSPRGPTTPEPRHATRASLSPVLGRTLGSPGRGSPLARSPGRVSSPFRGTSSPHSSPLTPLQFLRRADEGSPSTLALPSVIIRPTTPTQPRLSLTTTIKSDRNASVPASTSTPKGPPSTLRRWRP